ncbi:recombinase family protein, partial [Achromobacter xylosoxidans]|uniref:recombinase family protein n=1 Tax=Alcaligenes xylosoxydans xylosoxydans TaxID=85698 RepID=UPI001EEE6242
VLNKLLEEAEQDDILLVESVDRLSRLKQNDFDVLKHRIKDKGIRLIVADLPTTHVMMNTDDSITNSIMELVNNLLID